MRIILIVFILLCSYQYTLAQHKVWIKDQQTDEIIKSVSLICFPSKIKVHSRDSGYVSIPLGTDSVKVSRIGYNIKTVTLASIKNDAIYLTPDIRELEEVQINTGYSSIPKERATGSFETLSNNELSQVNATNILDKLDGQSTILFDRSNYSINGHNHNRNMLIRGPSSLYSDASPLVIVDNFPFEGNLNSINPNDIENVTILKDAAAASIWGARAGNGVIVITTKRASKGQSTKFNFSLTNRLEEKPNLYKGYSLSSADFIAVERDLYEKGFYTNQINSKSYPSLSPVVELLLSHKDGYISESELENQMILLASNDVRDDYLKYVYRSPYYQQYALGVELSGGNYTSRIGIGFDKNDYTLKTNSYERFTVNVNNSVKLKSYLTINHKVMFGNEHDASVGAFGSFGYDNSFLNGKVMYPYAKLVDDSGAPTLLSRNYSNKYLEGISNYNVLDWNYKLLEDMYSSLSKERNQSILLAVNPVLDLGKGLKVEFNYQYQHQQTTGNTLYDESSYYARNLINLYSQFTDGKLTRVIPIGGILDRAISTRNNHSFRGQINYNKVYNSDHRLDVLVGAELRKSKIDTDQIRRYGYQSNNLSYTEVNYNQSYPMLDGLSFAKMIPNSKSLNWTENRFLSFYTNASYSYQGKHVVTASARRDASNIFGVNTNEKWSPFWSVGYLWNVLNESYGFLNGFNQFKFRATYGFSGNIDPNRRGITAIKYSSSNDSYYNLPYASIANASNNDLRWEKVNTLNIGLDIGLKKPNVNMSLDLFEKRTTDLFAFTPMDPSSGFLNVITNNGEMKARGIELKATVRYGKDYDWNGTSSFNFSYVRTKITKLYKTLNSSSALVSSSGLMEGKLYQSIFSYRYLGLSPDDGSPIGQLEGQASSNYMDIINNTKDEELIYHGSSIPLFYGNFSQNVSYKDFSVWVNLIGKFHYFFRRPSIDYSRLFNENVGHPDYEKRWLKSGDERNTNIPASYYPLNSYRENFYRNNEVLVDRGDFIRIQDIRFLYRASKLERVFNITNLNIFAQVSNLGTIWVKNKEGVDPTYINYGIGPARTYAVGINLNF